MMRDFCSRDTSTTDQVEMYEQPVVFGEDRHD